MASFQIEFVIRLCEIILFRLNSFGSNLYQDLGYLHGLQTFELLNEIQ